LLTVHYHLTELETFRNETLAQAKAKVVRLERLDRLAEALKVAFERLVRRRIGTSCRARDQKALAIRLVKKAGNADVASRFRSLQADARTLKRSRVRGR
jgi:exocyst complex component 3